MIEVSLYSVPTGSNISVTMGKCIDRARYNKEALGVDIMNFVKGFLKTHINDYEATLGNVDVISFINNDSPMTTKDLASINYWMLKAGFLVKMFNVTDDEENAEGVSPESSEWNIINKNYLIDNLPTAIKVIPEAGTDIITVLEKVVDQVDVFNEKLGLKNPLKESLDELKKVKEFTGRIEPGLATKIYDILDSVGVELFLAIGE